MTIITSSNPAFVDPNNIVYDTLHISFVRYLPILTAPRLGFFFCYNATGDIGWAALLKRMREV